MNRLRPRYTPTWEGTDSPAMRKNTRSPAAIDRKGTKAPVLHSLPVLWGRRMPHASRNNRATRPEQSMPDLLIPPYLYGTPTYACACRTSRSCLALLTDGSDMYVVVQEKRRGRRNMTIGRMIFCFMVYKVMVDGKMNVHPL